MAKQCGGAVDDGLTGPGSPGGFYGGSLQGLPVSGVLGESQAAMMGRIPPSLAGQGMNFQARTSLLHRSRKNRSRKNRSRKQRGGAAEYPTAFGTPFLDASQMGAIRAGGSGTYVLDNMLTDTHSRVSQVGGGYRTRKNRQNRNRQTRQNRQNRNRQNRQNRNRQNRQNRNRQNRQNRNRKSQKKQRGGTLGFGPAGGPYDLGVSLKDAGGASQWTSGDHF
jgi:hypothetical protein